MAYRKRSDRKRVEPAKLAHATPEPEMPPVSKQKSGPEKRGERIKGNIPRSHLGKRSRSAYSSARETTGPEGIEPRLLADGGCVEEERANGGGIHIKPSHKGLLHKDLGIAAGKPISSSVLEHAKSGASPAEKKRIVFAENAKKWHHGG